MLQTEYDAPGLTGGGPVEIVTVVFIVLVSLKLISVVNHLRWLHRHGQSVAPTLRSLDISSSPDRTRLFWTLPGAKFFPFGLRETRLRALVFRLKERGALSRLAAKFVDVFNVRLFRFHIMAPLGAIYISAYLFVPDRLSLFRGSTGDTLVITSGLLLMATSVTLAIKSAYSYALVEDAALFRVLDRKKGPVEPKKERSLAVEIRMYVGTVLMGYVAAVATTAFTSAAGNNYKTMPEPVSTPAAYLSRIADAAFYTLTNFFGSGGDGEPTSVTAKLVTGMSVILGATMLPFVLGVLLSRFGKSEESSRPPDAEKDQVPAPPPTPPARSSLDTSRNTGVAIGTLVGVVATAGALYGWQRRSRSRRR